MRDLLRITGQSFMFLVCALFLGMLLPTLVAFIAFLCNDITFAHSISNPGWVIGCILGVAIAWAFLAERLNS